MGMNLVKSGKSPKPLFYVGIMLGVLIATPPAYFLLQRFAPSRLIQHQPLLQNVAETTRRLERAAKQDTLNHAIVSAWLSQGIDRHQHALREGNASPVYFKHKTYPSLAAFKNGLQQLYQKRLDLEAKMESLWQRQRLCQYDVRQCDAEPMVSSVTPNKALFDDLLRQHRSSAYVDWHHGWIYAVGEVHSSQQLPLAQQQAQQLAVARIRKTIHALQVNADTTLATITADNDAITQGITRLLERIEIFQQAYGEENDLQLIARVSLLGRKGLAALLLPLETKRRADDVFYATSPSHPISTAFNHTGLIVDARGLQALPGLFPRLLNRSGQVIYDASRGDPNALLKRGLVIYSHSRLALQSDPHLGDKPLLVTALEASGRQRIDLVVTDSVAEKVLVSNEKANFFQQARVGFVID